MRYFYTDPLAANWMMKHFGMRMQHLASDGVKYQDVTWPDEWFVHWHSKMYIHPDSLHILEPQNGDIGINSINSPGEFEIDGFRDRESIDVGECKIILRNNISFMWPESE